MTCVIGLRVEGGALLAFDSFAGHVRRDVRRDLKGAQLRPWLALGYTTSYRFGQILTCHLDHRLRKGSRSPEDPYEWAMLGFVPQARAALAEHGWLKKEHEREEAGDVLLAVCDRVLVVHSDFQVAESERPFAAIGSGQDEAMGALGYALHEGRSLDRSDVTIALEVAAELVATVTPPWHFMETVN